MNFATIEYGRDALGGRSSFKNMQVKLKQSLRCRASESRRLEESGFTFTDLIAVVAIVGLVAGIVYPAFAQGKPRSQQVICFNNLRQVGQAVMLFNAENGQTDPWRTPGAGYQNPAGNNVFYQCLFLSNGISNPKVLACPSDALVRVAKNYSQGSDGGFLNPFYRNSAVSYFWGLDSSPLVPRSILSGDRNIRYDSLGGGCSSGINPVFSLYASSAGFHTGWRSGLHGPAGNLLLHDGRVEQTVDETANRVVTRESDDNGSIHLQLPRP